MYIMEYYGSNDWRDYHLAHHGVKGMHWGIRRFQPYSVTGPRKGGATGKLVGLAKKVASGTATGAKYAAKGAKIAAKGAKAGAYALASHRQKAKMRKQEEEKEKILKTGSAEKVLANKDKFSNEELEAFMTRVGKEQKVADLAKKQNPDNWDKADDINAKAKKIVDYMTTANNLATQGINLHKNVKNISNIMKGTDEELKKIINSGDPELVMKNIHRMDANQQKEANAVINTRANIQKMAKEAVKKRLDSEALDQELYKDKLKEFGTDRDNFAGASKKHGYDYESPSNETYEYDSKTGKFKSHSNTTQNPDFKSGDVNNYGPANNAGKTNNLFGKKSFNDRDDKSYAEGQASQIKKQMGRDFEDNNNAQTLKPKALPGPKSSDGGNSGGNGPAPSDGGNGKTGKTGVRGMKWGVRDVPDSAKKAAKSSSMEEGIKLTFDSNQHVSNDQVREAARNIASMAQKHYNSYKRTKKDRDLADATFEEILRRVSGEG